MDAYDVMTSTRPYHDKKSKKESIAELRKCSGIQFEPRLVNKFIEFVE